MVESVDGKRVIVSDDPTGLVGELLLALMSRLGEARLEHLLAGTQSTVWLAPGLVAERGERDERLRWTIRRGDASAVVDATEIERMLDHAYELRRMHEMQQFPLGATLDDGRYVVTDHLYGGPDRGLYRARESDSEHAVLVTIGPHQEDIDALREQLAWNVPGVARLRHIGALAPDYTVMIEDEPSGTPASTLAFDARRAARLGVELARIAQGGPFGGIRSELCFVDGTELCIAPRCERFLSTAPARSYGVAPMFENFYLAPELLALAPLTAKADVFSICAIVAHWATGEHPFEGTSAAQAVSIATNRRRPWRGPQIFGTLVDEGLHPDPDARPTLGYLIEVLEQLAEQPR